MPSKSSNLQVETADVSFLELRGARSHRGHGDFSRSAVLHRQLRGLRALLEHADPRPRLPPAVYQAAIDLLPAAWELSAFEIELLDQILARAPGYAALLAERGVEEPAFHAAIAALSFFEKYALTDLAVQAHAPAASEARPEER
jgi:hypothetical protein